MNGNNKTQNPGNPTRPQIDLGNTEKMELDGNVLFQPGFILRKVSKFIAGTEEDAIIPIQVFFDPKTNKIVEQMLPKELRDEYTDYII